MYGATFCQLIRLFKTANLLFPNQDTISLVMDIIGNLITVISMF
jgi:hypothetical protein